jgi:regulatory protein YycI of two-component signal transduction system YycFG
MNWSKAKNILIIAFLLVNIYLSYLLINMSKPTEEGITNDYKRMVVELLNEHNITLATNIPSTDNNIPEITVKYEIYNPSDERYSKFNIQEQNKSLYYESESTDKVYRNLNIQMAEKISLEFINQNGFNNKDIKLWSITFNEGKYVVEYKQQYNDMTFDEGFMKIRIDETGVVSFERRWLVVEGAKDNTQKIIEPYKALMLSMDKLPKSGMKITEIVLTYKLINDAIDTPWYNIDHGTLSPYWIIRFEDNTSINIKAYQ